MALNAFSRERSYMTASNVAALPQSKSKGNVPATNDAGLRFTQDQIELIKSQVAKGATNDELQMFLHLAQKYDLDPMAKQIWFIKRPKKQKINGQWDYPRNLDGCIDYSNAETIIMTSRDGYLSIAQRHPEFTGPPISFVVCEGDEFGIDAQNFQVHHRFGGQRGKILGAWARCDRKGKTPSLTFVPFNEYCGNSPTWRQYPSAMIRKVAENDVLKRQFGITGLATQEELGQMDIESADDANNPSVIHTPETPPKEEATNKQPPIDVETPERTGGSSGQPLKTDNTQQDQSSQVDSQPTGGSSTSEPVYTMIDMRLVTGNSGKPVFEVVVDGPNGKGKAFAPEGVDAFEKLQNLGFTAGSKVKVDIEKVGNVFKLNDIWAAGESNAG